MGLRIGFTTFADQPEITADDQLAAHVLTGRGVEVVALPWDAPGSLDLAAGLAAVVMRSSWNYHLAPDTFATWVTAIEARGVPVVNPAPVVRWNLHKRYLAELAAAGVAVPTTIAVDAGAAPALVDLLDSAGLDEVVIKPAISLSAFETWRTRRADANARDGAAQAAFARVVAERAVLVQRFIPEVLGDGETSFVFFDGGFSHAVRKRARAGDFRVQSDHGGTREPCTPSPALVEQARAVLAHAPAPPSYARVDGIDVDGTLVLMELELIDPVLFLAFAPTAPAAFAAAILRQLSAIAAR